MHGAQDYLLYSCLILATKFISSFKSSLGLCFKVEPLARCYKFSISNFENRNLEMVGLQRV